MKNSFDYFSLDYFTKIKIRKKINEYVVVKPKAAGTKYKSMLVWYGYGFLDDIINYYNQDLTLTASICTSIKYGKKTEKKICYHLDSFYFRLISCWDYIFIGLNEYLQTELISSRDIKEKIIEKNCFYNEFTPHESGGTQVNKIPYPEEDQEEIKKELKKELIVLTPSKLKSVIEKKYEVNDTIKQIFEIYDCNKALQEAKTIRNTIIHSDSLSKGFNFGVDDIFMSQVISSKQIEDTSKKIDLVEMNMEALKKAIELYQKMIIFDLFPNRIKDKEKEFYVQLFKCNDCETDYVFPSDYIETLSVDPICLKCGCDSKKFEYVETAKVSQPYYDQTFLTFTEDLIDYFAQTDNPQ